MIGLIGAEGFVGSAFARYFAVNGEDYFPITRSSAAQSLDFEFELVINAAGSGSKLMAERDFYKSFTINISEIAWYLSRLSYSKFVHLSSIDVYSDFVSGGKVDTSPLPCTELQPSSKYGLLKTMQEKLVSDVAEDWVICRLGGMVGPGMSKGVVHDVLMDEAIWMTPESHVLTLETSVVASAVMSLQSQKNGIFNVAASEPISVKNVADLLGRTLAGCKREVTFDYQVDVSATQHFLCLPTSVESMVSYIKNSN